MRSLKKILPSILGSLIIIGIIGAEKFPVISIPKKQYLISDNGQVDKIIASQAGTVKQTMVEAVKGASTSSEIVAGDEFAKWAVLDYYPGGYHVVYPDGFKINYTASNFEASAPGGGKIDVDINGKNFTVSVDSVDVGAEQIKMLTAAASLIKTSFRFISSQTSEDPSNLGRFSN